MCRPLRPSVAVMILSISLAAGVAQARTSTPLDEEADA